MDFSEKWGKDVKEATRLALIDLKLTAAQVNVTVLEEPTKGFFGIGSKLAKVRVEKKPELIYEQEEKASIQRNEIPGKEEKDNIQRYEISRKPEISQKKAQENRPEKKDQQERKPGRKKYTNDIAVDDSFSVREKPDDLKELSGHIAESFLKDTTQKMGLNLRIRVRGNDSCIYVDMDGKDSGTIIGKRGQTLDAVQYLTSLVVNKDKDKYLRVVVDAEHYREKREKTLEQLANRLADKVIKTRKNVRLEPMNSYERKIIHATLQSNPKIITRSEGEEPYRRVIIGLK